MFKVQAILLVCLMALSGSLYAQSDEEGTGCTYTIGFWKTHSSQGPAPYSELWEAIGEDSPFFNSDITFLEALSAKAKGPGGNIYRNLAQQWVGATLNAAVSGVEVPAEVQTALIKGAVLLEENSDTRQFERLDYADATFHAETLAAYNEGLTGPGHCDDATGSDGGGEGEDDNEEFPTKIGTNDSFSFSTVSGSDTATLANYPEPFNPRTTLSVTLPAESNLTLKVYDLSGKLVAQLASGTYSEGRHTFDWNASHLSTGIYLSRLVTGSEVVTSRITLLK